MSDYMFMLESHLNADQSRVVSQVQSAASAAGVNLFLTGGAPRDMLAGFPVVEIEFTVEGDGLKLAEALAAKTGAAVIETDEIRRSAQLVFPGGVRAAVGMARQEKYPEPGGNLDVRPATIHEDLRGRDFTVNAIALSLNAASRGLLLDPNNGAGDIERKELRTVTNYALYDNPVRLLRLQRFKVRLGFTIVERTQAQYANAREQGLDTNIAPPALLEELRRIACEQNLAELVRVLDHEGLLRLYSPALTASKLNFPALSKLQKVRQLIPFGVDARFDYLSVFLNIAGEKLTPEERAGIAHATHMPPDTVERWQKLDARSKKLEKELKPANLVKPSLLYQALSKAPGNQVLWLMTRSAERLVQDRIKNYLQKYVPAAQEVTEHDILAAGGGPGTSKYEKVRAASIAARLDARPKKAAPPVEVPPESLTAPVFARK